MISSNTLYLKIDKASVDGKKEFVKDTPEHLSVKKTKQLEQSRIDKDQYIAMEQFAKLLPRGKRKLKLNMKELREEIFSNPKLATLTDDQGLKSGGIVSYKLKGNAVRGSKKIDELTQRDFGVSIKNNNRVTSDVNLNNGKNPNYASFKNNFVLK